MSGPICATEAAAGRQKALPFLCEVFRGCNGFVEFRELRSHGCRQFFSPLPLSQLPGVNVTAHDIYFGVAPRTKQNGTASAVKETGALWADVDGKVFEGKKPGARERLSSLGALTPSIIVDSGHGYHAYWLLASPLPIAQAQGLMELLRNMINSSLDRVSDAPRILRVPGTLNHKGTEPLPVTIAHWKPERRFSSGDFARLLPQWSSIKGCRKRDGPSTPAVTVIAPETLLRGVPEGQRNESLFRYLRSLRARGMDLAEAVVLAGTAGRNCTPPYPVASEDCELRADSHEPVAVMAARIWRDCPGPPGTATDHSQPHHTDWGNAQRLVARHGPSLRFCHTFKRWYVWNGKRWKIDDTGRVERLAKDTLRAVYLEATQTEDRHARKDIARWAIQSESQKHLKAMLSLAQSEPGIHVIPDEFDGNPYLLTVDNGTLDLQTGVLRPPDPKDMVTRLAPIPFHPDAAAPRWSAFLDRIMGGSDELIAFLQRAVGYSLTGDTSERVLFILHGCGANGKSTLLEALRAMMGDYALRTPTETLLASRGGSIPNDVARLKGARFVTASESEEGRRFAEARIKDLTGGDTISARFLHAEFFDFRPECKIWLATNHKPAIRGTEGAIWQRVRLVPFSVEIPEEEQDKHLIDKLKAELPGILAWAVRGCLDWLENGLGVPTQVASATQRYRQEMDALGSFIEECCELDERARATSTELYSAYERWCEANGEHLTSKRELALRFRERGFESCRTGKARGWTGVRVTQVTEDDACSR